MHASLPFRRRGPVLGLLVGLLIASGPARAVETPEPDPKRRAEASAHLKRGAELIDAEDLQGALAEFEAAYRLVPSPNILHNFGIVYQGLGRKAAAMDAFQRFLDEADKAPPAARTHAQQAVAGLRREVAELRVEADVAGASIFVDARKVAETPQGKPIYLDPGPHHLSVEKPGGGTMHTERLEVSAGQQVTVPARLAAVPAPAPPELSAAPPAESPGTWQRPTAWAAAVGAAAAAGLFTTQFVVRHRRFSDFNRTGCGYDNFMNYPTDCRTLYDQGKRAEKWAIASGVAAGALAAGAITLFLTAPDAPVSVSIGPAAAGPRVGLGLQGRF